MFISGNRRPPSAWWLVPIGVVLITLGLLVPWGDDYASSKGAFICWVGGAMCIAGGVIWGLKGQRLEK